MRTSPTRRRRTTVRSSTTSAERAAADAEGTMATLQDIMTRDVFTTGGDASVADVAESMLKGRFGSAVIVDGAWIVGMFTERDVLRAAAAGTDPRAALVTEWMTPDPVTASPDLDAEEAAEIMMTQGFRHLPVVVGNKLLGMVSLPDVLRVRVRRGVGGTER